MFKSIRTKIKLNPNYLVNQTRLLNNRQFKVRFLKFFVFTFLKVEF